MRSRLFLLIAMVLLTALPSATQQAAVPALSWSCPMHADVVEDHKGKCLICGMTLVPVRLDYAWSCPVHSVIDETRAGKCPICGRDLVQMTVAVTYFCPDRPASQRINPGKCADGSATIPRRKLRAHGNHSPQHGGIFFMAADNWHHLEGTHPQAGLFRLFLYDDYSKTLAAGEMRQITGTVSRKTAVAPLRLAADGKSLEAKLDGLAPPAELVAKLRFKKAGPEYRFDFVFPEFSRDAPASPPVSLAMHGEDGDDLERASTAGLVGRLGARSREIQELIEKGAFGEIYVAAFQAKDAALVLESRVAGLPAAKRAATTAAIERLVRTAWQLDAYGDLGDRELIHQAYAVFARASEDISSAFGGK